MRRDVLRAMLGIGQRKCLHLQKHGTSCLGRRPSYGMCRSMLCRARDIVKSSCDGLLESFDGQITSVGTLGETEIVTE